MSLSRVRLWSKVVSSCFERADAQYGPPGPAHWARVLVSCAAKLCQLQREPGTFVSSVGPLVPANPGECSPCGSHQAVAPQTAMNLTEAQKSACLASKQQMLARVVILQQRKLALQEMLLRPRSLENGDHFDTVRAQFHIVCVSSTWLSWALTSVA